jgi:hypothetical protein
MPLTTFGAHRALDDLLGSGNPATLFLALMFGPSNLSGTLNEPLASQGYARKEISNGPLMWPAAANREKRNGEQIVFAPATENWGGGVSSIRNFAVCTAATGGSVIGWGTVPSRMILTGDEVAFKINTIVIKAE